MPRGDATRRRKTLLVGYAGRPHLSTGSYSLFNSCAQPPQFFSLRCRSTPRSMPQPHADKSGSCPRPTATLAGRPYHRPCSVNGTARLCVSKVRQTNEPTRTRLAISPPPLRCSLVHSEAADQGHVFSAYQVAECYMSGRGVPRDMKRAREFYEKTVQGHVVEDTDATAASSYTSSTACEKFGTVSNRGKFAWDYTYHNTSYRHAPPHAPHSVSIFGPNVQFSARH